VNGDLTLRFYYLSARDGGVRLSGGSDGGGGFPIWVSFDVG
jgi:hypothetical protein